MPCQKMEKKKVTLMGRISRNERVVQSLNCGLRLDAKITSHSCVQGEKSQEKKNKGNEEKEYLDRNGGILLKEEDRALTMANP